MQGLSPGEEERPADMYLLFIFQAFWVFATLNTILVFIIVLNMPYSNE